MILIVRTDAEYDIQQAYQWYERKQPGLGEDFLEQVAQLLRQISNNPFLYSCIYQQLRRASTRKYPYSAYFIVEDDKIIVLRVLHQKRSPELWHVD